MVDKVFKVIAGKRLMMIDLAVFAFGNCPDFPFVLFVNNPFIGFTGKLCRGFFVLLKIIQIFQKENPRGLLHIVQLAAATCVFVEDVVYILEGLFKQGNFSRVKIFSLASGIKGRDWGIV